MITAHLTDWLNDSRKRSLHFRKNCSPLPETNSNSTTCYFIASEDSWNLHPSCRSKSFAHYWGITLAITTSYCIISAVIVSWRASCRSVIVWSGSHAHWVLEPLQNHRFTPHRSIWLSRSLFRRGIASRSRRRWINNERSFSMGFIRGEISRYYWILVKPSQSQFWVFQTASRPQLHNWPKRWNEKSVSPTLLCFLTTVNWSPSAETCWVLLVVSHRSKFSNLLHHCSFLVSSLIFVRLFIYIPCY